MLTYGFLALLAVLSVVAFADWRKGVVAAVVVAMVQDPVRKCLPGTPAYLVLAVVPVWIAVLAGAWRERDLAIAELAMTCPRLRRTVWFYLAALLVPIGLSLSYGAGSWQCTLLGLFSQTCLLGGVVLGFSYPLRLRDLERLMAAYCILAAIALVGGPLEKLGVGRDLGLTGTRSLGAYWVTYRTGAALEMVSGFFRSPDIMGWHGAMLVMMGTTLTLASRGIKRVPWALLAGWGCVALMICARRKMITMVLVYAFSLLGLYVAMGHARRVLKLLAVVLVVSSIGAVAYVQMGADDEVAEFYASTLGELDTRLEGQSIVAVWSTYQQAGFWGHGLGMAMQGVHHLQVQRPRVWQESGLSILFAEVGFPGTVAFLAMATALAFALWRSVAWGSDSPEHTAYLGLAAMVIANVAAAMVSAQILGDPFIGCFLPFLTGLTLSGIRLEAPEDDMLPEDVPEAPAEATPMGSMP